MRIKYKTATNINGNTYYLLMDTEKKEINTNASFYSSSDIDVKITRKEMAEIKEAAKRDGWKIA